MTRCRRTRCTADRAHHDRLLAALARAWWSERDGWEMWADLACSLYPPPDSFRPLAIRSPHAHR